MNMNQKDDVIASLNNLEQDEKLSVMLDKQIIYIQSSLSILAECRYHDINCETSSDKCKPKESKYDT
jgi:hypothetical protein